ncbi:DUF2520 domain-containing protein [Dysgonomonas sp. 216]|uniref:Rossmann-like and DUF2520 domain-containing protein n=1 Tax=Dysgonomonas sp. 216 TaxID=2302934 RepID=UPI0013D25BF5|nr:Rossmann-like and DUF2520 domain-containing protein [Dysgonomonas sp. 216]NDW18057.1 DUF2520 domain-containing protein [Dysgonomonas sp. 216]
MKVVFIGAGNLATRLGIELYKNGFEIQQVYSRTIQSAQLLAEKVKSEAVNNIKNVDRGADIYIFSVKDSVLAELIAALPPNKGVWIHTAGSIPLSVFEGYSNNYGVVYPFQTFSKNHEIDFSKIPFFFEANTPEVLHFLMSTFVRISDKQMELLSEKRRLLHLTGVFGCNFVNHMYAISADIVQKAGVPFEYVYPLIDETLAKIHQMSPREAQTGPAIRFDTEVMDKHIALIDSDLRRSIYKLVSKDINESNK